MERGMHGKGGGDYEAPTLPQVGGSPGRLL